jgi:hypothetical protein
VQIEPITETAVRGRDDIGLSVNGEANVTDESLVENAADLIKIVDSTLR